MHSYATAVTLNTLRGLSDISEHFKCKSSKGIPVYKAVRVNSRKASTYLKKCGWKVQGRYKTLMVKAYKSLMYYDVHAYVMDDLVIISYLFNETQCDDKVVTRKFAKTVQIVNNIAKSLGNIE